MPSRLIRVTFRLSENEFRAMTEFADREHMTRECRTKKPNRAGCPTCERRTNSIGEDTTREQ
jgi:hypothetical protein